MFENLQTADILLIFSVIYFVATTALWAIAILISFVMLTLLSIITVPVAWLQRRFERREDPNTSVVELIEA